jgi:AcrR family transcriptional regulator
MTVVEITPSSARRKDALAAAAKRAFERQGYARTTVQHIIDEADVTRRTFYRYFSSKDDVFAHLLAAMASELAATLDVAIDEPSMRARLRAHIVTILRIGRSERDFLRVVDEAIRVQEEHARAWEVVRATFERRFRLALDWCIRHDLIDPMDTEVMAFIGSSLVELLVLGASRYEASSSMEDTLVEMYWNMFFRPREGADDYVRKPGGIVALFADRKRRVEPVNA